MAVSKLKEQTETIQFIGINDLRVPEQEAVHAIAQEYVGKFKHTAHPFSNLVVHIKCYNQQGQRRKYSVHVRFVSPTHSFESKTDDWTLSPVLHKAFEDIIKQMHHKLHTDVSRPR